ncbi:MAG: hypothetical protein JWO90_10 [Solirubrobacterales bacterium]|nr:hypothetical protein [Solirubrobacterales bacterium]
MLGALATGVLVAPPGAAAASTAGQLRAGAGQADITPPRTGYYLGGWTRADRLAKGQSTRLYANALVLQRGERKMALVAVELFSIAAGLQEDVARELADLGYDQSSVLLAASHTHSGPGGFSNNPTYNTAAPSAATITSPETFVQFFSPLPADRQLYTFLVKQIAASIRRADADRGLAEAAWGHTRLTDLTDNRSIEAHLANYGIDVPFGEGRADMAPGGRLSTIDPTVDVLRVDKLRARKGKPARRIPIGAYSNFADHGTVVKSETEAYSGDHHAAAWRLFADRVRKAAKVPRLQTVVNVYPNGAEGDQSAGLRRTGIAGAVEVGSREAEAMFEAWRDAGKRMSRTPVLDLRWTRTCFCGRDTATGPVDDEGVVGAGFLTGSEEGRGPLFEITGIPLEGRTSPVEDPVQGRKLQVPVASPPPATVVGVYRIGDGVIATIPGEPTKEVGVRVRKAVLAELAGKGVESVTIGGLAQDFIQYVTTPEEYGTQSYEGASTLYGTNTATFLQERLAELARAMATGGPAPMAFPLDTSFGVLPDGPAFDPGADRGTITTQPAASVARLEKVTLAWTGGVNGSDRPVDRAFVSAQRLVGKRWRTVDSDLALAMLWRADAAGRYTLEWQPAATVPVDTYRLRVTATRYELVSRSFAVTASTAARVRAVRRAADGSVRATLAFPAYDAADLIPPPPPASVRVPARYVRGGRVVLPAAAVHDRRGNPNGAPASLPLG